MKRKKLTVTRMYWQGVSCAEQLIVGFKQVAVRNPHSNALSIANSLYILNHYINDMDFIRILPVYFHLLDIPIPRPIRNFSIHTKINLIAAFRLGMSIGLEELIDSPGSIYK